MAEHGSGWISEITQTRVEKKSKQRRLPKGLYGDMMCMSEISLQGL